jgi:hypothetical protein
VHSKGGVRGKIIAPLEKFDRGRQSRQNPRREK